MASLRKPLLVVLEVLLILLIATPAFSLSIFSEGMSVPETISKAPSDFGAYGGQYFVPDPNPTGDKSTIWRIDPQGEQAQFSDNSDYFTVGGLFLPEGWGDLSGYFLTVGWERKETDGGTVGGIFAYDQNGENQQFVIIDDYDYVSLTTPEIIPTRFGDYEGMLAVTDQQGRIFVVNPNGNVQTIVETMPIHPFGLAFAPTGFGDFNGKMFISDGWGNQIYTLDQDGNLSLFTIVPLLPGQWSLRQMAFAPTNFLSNLGIPGDLLFVSVSGSYRGGGTLGDVLALDETGKVVASLRVLDDLEKFDPRGLYFTDDGHLLISDASDPIIIAKSDDFVLGRNANVVPEPTTWLLVGVGLVGLIGLGKKKFS